MRLRGSLSTGTCMRVVDVRVSFLVTVRMRACVLWFVQVPVRALLAQFSFCFCL